MTRCEKCGSWHNEPEHVCQEQIPQGFESGVGAAPMLQDPKEMAQRVIEFYKTMEVLNDDPRAWEMTLACIPYILGGK